MPSPCWSLNLSLICSHPGIQCSNSPMWDEVSMSHRNVFQAVDRMLMDIRVSTHPFGGLTVFFGGDLQQTLPIIQGGSCEGLAENLHQKPLSDHQKVVESH